MKLKAAIGKARWLAAAGPRVAIVIVHPTKGHAALPGYVDDDSMLPKGYKTLYLVTPDGRLWIAKE